MKRIIGLLLIILPFLSQAQSLDTVYVRHLTLQARDWAWLVGRNESSINRDSATAKAYRNIRSTVQEVQNLSTTTNVTIDSIPGKIVKDFYATVKFSNAGEISNRYNAITSAISGKAQMAYWVGYYDARVSADYEEIFSRGKRILLDQ